MSSLQTATGAETRARGLRGAAEEVELNPAAQGFPAGEEGPGAVSRGLPTLRGPGTPAVKKSRPVTPRMAETVAGRRKAAAAALATTGAGDTVTPEARDRKHR